MPVELQPELRNFFFFLRAAARVLAVYSIFLKTLTCGKVSRGDFVHLS